MSAGGVDPRHHGVVEYALESNCRGVDSFSRGNLSAEMLDDHNTQTQDSSVILPLQSDEFYMRFIGKSLLQVFRGVVWHGALLGGEDGLFFNSLSHCKVANNLESDV